jgi:hypothetical protein
MTKGFSQIGHQRHVRDATLMDPLQELLSPKGLLIQSRNVLCHLGSIKIE